MKPFLKWAGGKTQLIDQLVELAPAQPHTYFEPFVGGGALFFSGRVRSLHNYVSDINPELANAYYVVRDHVDVLIEYLREHQQNHSKEYYYQIRALDRLETYEKDFSFVQRAARVIYLNKTCFNGLYRLNSKGQFNSAFGSYKNPKICDESVLRNCSKRLRENTTIFNCHFSCIDPSARSFVFLDPPYMPLNSTSKFTEYFSKFDEEDHQQLKDKCIEWHKRGVLWLQTNSNHPFIRELYKDFRIIETQARRRLSGSGDSRGSVTELIILNY